MSIAQSTAVEGRDLHDHATPSNTISAEDYAQTTLHDVNSSLARHSGNTYYAVAANIDKTSAKRLRVPDQAENRLADIVDMPVFRQSTTPIATLHPLQEWEGYVIEINNDGFTARLLDLTAGASYEDEEADIPLEEVSESDAAGMQVGSIFRWVIGYERSPAGTKKRISQIVFRDLPATTKSDLQAANKWARGIITAWKE